MQIRDSQGEIGSTRARNEKVRRSAERSKKGIERDKHHLLRFMEDIICLFQKSENALTDAKLKVSQTKNEQLLKERELKSKEEEAAAQMLKMKNNKEA